MKIIISIASVVGVLFLSGCASIMSGTKQEMTFQTSPEGATVTVNGRILGKAPFTVQLDKKKDQSVIFSLDGYKPVTMQLTTRMDSWFWGNIILGGLFGSTTDGINGAVYEYSPSQYLVNLVPEKTSRLEVHTAQSHREKIRGFVMIRYQNIVADLNNGAGNDVSSLFSMLSVSRDREQIMLGSIIQLSKDTHDIYAFADKVSQLYIE